VIDKSARSAEDARAQVGLGMACTRSLDRVCAAMGVIRDAPTEFHPASGVSHGGVLLALPALLQNGLLARTELLPMNPAFYALHDILLLLSFMALARVHSIEQLRWVDAGEWGRLLGLDRIPEVRTLREKIAEITRNAERIREWQRRQSADWMAEDPEMAGRLYVDGHVRVYFGDQVALLRRYVSRQRLCLRGITDYWVNDQLGKPYFVISTPLTEGLQVMLRQKIVPRLLADVPNQPTEQELAADPRRHRFVIIVDREGYSPAFFKEMWELRIACQTYHKHPGPDWPTEEFVDQEVRLPCGEIVRMALAERTTQLSNGMDVREIRKLGTDQHQTSVITMDLLSTTAMIMAYMVARWSQENFFRYMAQEFDIDKLAGYQAELFRESGKIVNPAYRQADALVRKQTAIVTRRQREFGQQDLLLKGAIEQCPAAVERLATLQAKCEEVEQELVRCKARRAGLAKHINIDDLTEDEKIRTLAPVKKLFLDAIKMIAYRAETAMVALVRPVMARADDARSLLQQIFATPADILPDPQTKTLTIKLHHLTCGAHDRIAQRLIEELNAAEINYPGTDLRLVYQMVSSPIPPDQEF
jgi:hypothetical protein